MLDSGVVAHRSGSALSALCCLEGLRPVYALSRLQTRWLSIRSMCLVFALLGVYPCVLLFTVQVQYGQARVCFERTTQCTHPVIADPVACTSYPRCCVCCLRAFFWFAAHGASRVLPALCFSSGCLRIPLLLRIQPCWLFGRSTSMMRCLLRGAWYCFAHRPNTALLVLSLFSVHLPVHALLLHRSCCL